MNESKFSHVEADYLGRVERLITDLDADERQSLLADLREQLADGQDEGSSRLGTPEAFVEEYRRSAGLGDGAERTAPRLNVASLISALALPFGVLILFSFGGQLILGPFVLVIEWVLARVSRKPIRVLWSILAGLLCGEIIYLVLDTYLNGFPLKGVVGLVTGGLVSVLIYRTAATDLSN